MSVGITEDHQRLTDATEKFLSRAAPIGSTRGHLEALGGGGLPGPWSELVEQGLLSLHIGEDVGGGGGDIVDLAIVVEAVGRTLFPGPVLSTVLASALLERFGTTEQRKRYAPGFVAGATGAVCLDSGMIRAERSGDVVRLYGKVEPVLGLPGADRIVVGARVGDEPIWAIVDTAASEAFRIETLPCVDLTRSIGSATFDGFEVPATSVLAGVSDAHVRALTAVLFSADALGAVRWCLATVLDYVKERRAFGQVVGSFQAVKHRCARILIQAEMMAAAVWDGARSFSDPFRQQTLATASTASICLEPGMDAALDALTLLGGIGFTWEHDIHLFWRRCIALAQLLGPRTEWDRLVGQSVSDEMREFAIDVPVDEAFRSTIRDMVAEIVPLPAAEQRVRMADLGLVSPQYPKPYGLGATPAQQLVITREMEQAGLQQPNLIVGEWALPTIITHGSESQRERFVPASLRGDIVWCQLFSEPGAGSDLASLATRASKTEDGWRLNGQKVWTSSAHIADWGVCLARTDPDAPKHQGISYFLVDMHSEGLEVRPIRQSSGDADFNEVFFDDVLVPDENLVGDVNAGWRLAQTTLGNERVQMGGGMLGYGLDPAAFAAKVGVNVADSSVAQMLGSVMAEHNCLSAMQMRSLLRRISGLQPGAEASVQKLAVSFHKVRVAKAAMTWAGPMTAAASDGPAGEAQYRYLSTPSSLLGGGTSEIQLNVIAERVLGLPRR